jgi:DNA-binding HxlR family transcriptional regulator
MVENLYHDEVRADNPQPASGAVTVGTRQRTYGQYCPVAAGLDLLGDRWVLLICRELSMGDRRFTDLRRALTGIAPNLLSERLRALVADGLVTSVELPPPAARCVYRLTDAGREAVPVLRALARFGVGFLDPDSDEARSLDAYRAAHALLLPWVRRPDVHLRVRLALSDDDVTEIVVDGDVLDVVRPGPDPDLTVTTTSRALLEARQCGGPLMAAVEGSAAARAAFVEAFRLELP